MPTGYTSILSESNCSFEKFVWRCARAFGPCVEMREESLDKLPPSAGFETSSYHRDALKKAEINLLEFQNLSPEKIQRQFEKAKQDNIARNLQRIEESKILEASYLAMLERVNKWIPPSSEHLNLKKFMIDQLTNSIKHDCMIDYYQSDLKLWQDRNVDDWYQSELKNLKWDIDHHTNYYQKDKDAYEKANLWLKQLERSVSRPDK